MATLVATCTAVAVDENLTTLIDWTSIEQVDTFIPIIGIAPGGSGNNITDVQVDSSSDGGITTDTDDDDGGVALPLSLATNFRQGSFAKSDLTYKKWVRIRAKCGAGEDCAVTCWLTATATDHAILQKTFAGIYQEVGGFLKNDRALAAAADLAECKRITNDGYLMFLSERGWTFLHPQATIVAWATATGTLTGVATITLTASAAIFYDSMVGHTLVFDTSETEYTIASVTSTTVCVLTASAAGELATDTITITADGHYRLPNAFGELLNGFSYDTSSPYAVMRPTSMSNIRNMQSSTTGLTGAPSYYCVQPETYATTTGQRWEVAFHPIPNADFTLGYRYRVNPASMGTDTEYPIGGPKHHLTVQQAALAVAEGVRGDVDGPQMKKYKELLQASFERDDADRPRNLGYNADRSDLMGQWPTRTVVIQALPEP